MRWGAGFSTVDSDNDRLDDSGRGLAGKEPFEAL